MKDMIVIGGGGHAKVVISLLKKIIGYNIIGYLDLADKGAILGINYLGNDSKLKFLRGKHPNCSVVIGICSLEISEKRSGIMRNLKSFGYDLPAIVSPGSIVNESVKIGLGTVICDGAVIGPGTKIGEGAIINTGASVDHDCEIGNFVNLAPGTVLCGGVKVKQNSIVAAGATILQYKTIGKNCLVGAGAVVVKDCLEAGTYLGVPAKRK